MNGLFNNYRSNMPLIERLIKDLKFVGLKAKHFFKNGFKNKTILVYPEFPNKRTTIFKIARHYNYNLTNNIKSKPDIIINWEDVTFKSNCPELQQFSKHVINAESSDISKVYVDNAFKEVFGYSTFIDPLTYKGKIVRKSDLNAKHDGTILNGPLKTIDEESIYQILIDNSYNDTLVKDIRVPVVIAALDFTYIKYRDITERFKNTTVDTQVVNTGDVLSKKEIELINQFCKKIHFEYGELDILRNKDDDKIYIVDINNTPYGPPANTPIEEEKKAIQELGRHLKEQFTF
ncbi:MAG: hypothetical protein ACKVJC_06305 [Flavobacteriales bacterium]